MVEGWKGASSDRHAIRSGSPQNKSVSTTAGKAEQTRDAFQTNKQLCGDRSENTVLCSTTLVSYHEGNDNKKPN